VKIDRNAENRGVGGGIFGGGTFGGGASDE
jgi:hypothetical protein